jgi:hypothetical protein
MSFSGANPNYGFYSLKLRIFLGCPAIEKELYLWIAVRLILTYYLCLSIMLSITDRFFLAATYFSILSNLDPICFLLLLILIVLVLSILKFFCISYYDYFRS